MSVLFKEEGHIYESIDGSDKIDWISITSLISLFHEKFDKEGQAIKSSKNKKSKWYGVHPKEIISIWDNESKRAIETGNFYHNQREADTLGLDTLNKNGKDIPIVKTIIKDGVKYAPNQKLVDGVYPEHLVYLKSMGVCGQGDRIEIYDNNIDVIDYKTNKKIEKESWKDWKGDSKRMLYCLKHLDDCNFVHYSLQLSIIAYIIKKHNPLLKVNNLTIQHVIFEKEGEDKYGYPILKREANGDYMIERVDYHKVDYMEREVKAMLNYYNKHLKKKK